MRELETSRAYKTFKNFESMNRIPRCSNNEQNISDFLVEFAKNLDLEVTQDETLNVLIKKPGTMGLEEHDAVALQAHMDMVCEKEETCTHDFEKDPIDMYIDDGYIKARGTTLGADNGLGVSLALDILESNDIKHPPLEVIITATEETGMDGAIGLSSTALSAKRLINLDTEDEGVMIIGCAGGINAFVELPMKYIEDKSLTNRTITISGLAGGHSGLTIGSEHMNAIKFLDNAISKLRNEMDIKLQNISGGTKHNAIPTKATAILGIKSDQIVEFENKFEKIANQLVNQYLKRESGLKIELGEAPNYDIYIEQDTSKKILSLISLLPHGVNTMASVEEELVESSNNLAIVGILNDVFKISLSIRSSNEEQRRILIDKVKEVARIIGAKVSFSDGYPMWQPNYESELSEIAKESYEHLTNEKLVVKTIHAGLETGLLSEKYPEMDMISIGPNIFGAHTPLERLSISSTEFTRDYLIDILSRL